MGRPRKFDHEYARRLRAAGLSYRLIAVFFGVALPSVRAACDDAYRAKLSAYQKNGTCSVCGGRASRAASRAGGPPRCRLCALRANVKTRDGMRARCGRCGQWKPLDDFRPDRKSPVRQVVSRCRDCETAARRDYRHRNPEKEAAATRRRRAAKRAAEAAE